MKKKIKLAILLLMMLSLIPLCGCNIVDDFINTRLGYLVIGGLTLFLVFKYGGKK